MSGSSTEAIAEAPETKHLVGLLRSLGHLSPFENLASRHYALASSVLITPLNRTLSFSSPVAGTQAGSGPLALPSCFTLPLLNRI